MEIQKQYEVDMAKQESLNGMRAQKTEEQLDIHRDQASQDMALKAERQAAELRMAALKTDAEIAIKKLKAEGGRGGAGSA